MVGQKNTLLISLASALHSTLLLALIFSLVLHGILVLSLLPYALLKKQGLTVDSSSIKVHLQQPPNNLITPLPYTKEKINRAQDSATLVEKVPEAISTDKEIRAAKNTRSSIEAVAKPISQFKGETKVSKKNSKISKKRNVNISIKSKTSAKADREQSYSKQLIAWINNYKRYPLVAQKRQQEGIVVVKFTINTEGKLLKQTIVEPSQYSLLNRAAEKMLKKASPMPVVPQEIRGSEIKFHYRIPIQFNLD